MNLQTPHTAISARMAGIRQKGTKIETQVATVLRELGLHYRRNVRNLPGSPDFANSSRCWAIFVNGCFWHHHTSCRKATLPKSNTEFWKSKFRANRQRDANAITELRVKGYKVVVVWECQVEYVQRKLGKILEAGRINAR